MISPLPCFAHSEPYCWLCALAINPTPPRQTRNNALDMRGDDLGGGGNFIHDGLNSPIPGAE